MNYDFKDGDFYRTRAGSVVFMEKAVLHKDNGHWAFLLVFVETGARLPHIWKPDNGEDKVHDPIEKVDPKEDPEYFL